MNSTVRWRIANAVRWTLKKMETIISQITHTHTKRRTNNGSSTQRTLTSYSASSPCRLKSPFQPSCSPDSSNRRRWDRTIGTRAYRRRCFGSKRRDLIQIGTLAAVSIAAGANGQYYFCAHILSTLCDSEKLNASSEFELSPVVSMLTIGEIYEAAQSIRTRACTITGERYENVLNASTYDGSFRVLRRYAVLHSLDRRRAAGVGAVSVSKAREGGTLQHPQIRACT